jgi:hypothetical protein
MAVILKIIWRAAPAPCGRRLGVSAKRSMSGHPQNVRLSGGDDAKPDGMIVGREGGPAPGNVGGDWPGPRQLPFKSPALNVRMTLKGDLLNQAVRSAKLPC